MYWIYEYETYYRIHRINEKMGRCMKINMFIHFDYLDEYKYRNRFRVANTNYVTYDRDDTIYWIRSNREHPQMKSFILELKKNEWKSGKKINESLYANNKSHP